MTSCIALDKTDCRFQTSLSSISSDLRVDRHLHSLWCRNPRTRNHARLWHMQKMHACTECSQKANPAVVHRIRCPCGTLIVRTLTGLPCTSCSNKVIIKRIYSPYCATGWMFRPARRHSTNPSSSPVICRYRYLLAWMPVTDTAALHRSKAQRLF